jgi:hypothetical protein
MVSTETTLPTETVAMFLRVMEACQSAIIAKYPSLAIEDKKDLLRTQLSRNIQAAYEGGERNEARLKRAALFAWGLDVTRQASDRARVEWIRARKSRQSFPGSEETGEQA